MRVPQQQRSSETKERILDLALTLFSERGYDAVGVREIAASARVNHGVVRYYFGSKERLWHQAVDHLFARLRAELQPTTAEADAEPEVRFRLLVHRYVRYCARHPEHARLMMQESMHDNPRIEWAAKEHILAGHRRLTPLLTQLIALGQLPDIPIVTLIYTLTAAAQSPFVLAPEIEHTHALRTLAPEFIEAHAESVVAIFLRQA